MAVTEVIARMYDSRGQKPAAKTPSEKGFDEAIDKAVNNNSVKDREVCVRCGQNHNLRPVLAADKIPEKTSTTEGVETTQAPETQEAPAISEAQVNSSAAYRFSIFIRTTSQISTYASSLAEKFKSATQNFIQALHQDSNSGINLFDNYLGQAANYANTGETQTTSFIEQMLEAADNGLKAVTASMNSSSMLGGLNLSMNSALPGTSAADIAGIYLQDAIKTGSINSSGQATVKSAGQGGLQLIRSEDLVASPPLLNPMQQSSPLIKNRILDRFMQLLEGLAGGFSPQQTEIQFSLQYGQIAGVTANSAPENQVLDKMPEAVEGEEKVSA